jgi:hypothetical protein
MPAILVYALLLFLIAVLILLAWQLWCAAALNLVNPILQALGAGTAPTQMCGRASDALQGVIDRIKALEPPKIDPINLSISPTLLVQIGIIIALVTTLILLGMTLNELMKVIKEDRARKPVPHPGRGLGEEVISWITSFWLRLQRGVGGERETKDPARVDEPPEPDDVFFTAIHPKEGTVAHWHRLLVYAHVHSMLEEVRRNAQQFTDEIGIPKEVRVVAREKLARGTEVTILPRCERITFEPEQIKFKWMEEYQRVVFRFRADPSLADDAASGEILIFVGPVIIGTLKFAMLFSSAEILSPTTHEEHSKMYRKDKIFVSYSHRDVDIVLEFKEVHKATGFDVLIDRDELRSGQEWDRELMQMIDRADIFQLFWSENSKKSKYCKKEWKQALQCKREGFIRPIYWQKPLPAPPRELSKYHFQYVALKKRFRGWSKSTR